MTKELDAIRRLTMTQPRRRLLSLAIRQGLDSRWIGELPIVFDGTPSQCVLYAKERGYEWFNDDDCIFGGRFEHPDEPWTLFPV